MFQYFSGLLMAFVVLLHSIQPFQAEAKVPKCENGECVQALIDQLENLNAIFQSQCLPQGIKESEINAHFEKNGLTEDCWKIVTEVSELEGKLQAHENELESKLGCNGENCKTANPESLNAQIANLSTVQSDSQCSVAQRKKINQTCEADRRCALVASAKTLEQSIVFSNPFFKAISQASVNKDCNLTNDSCFTQIGTAFFKSVFSLLEFGGEVISSAASYSYEKMKSFWLSVINNEDHSSTSQLALAKASEDPGFFQRLLDDFPGTMLKLWHGFLAGMQEWLKSDIFCAKWSGTPHYSECIVPTESFDCLSCKTQINGVCSVAGTIVSEVVPSFLTGGLVAAAKYGASAASKVAKSFKISSKARTLLKESTLAKLAVKSSSKIDDALKLTNKLKLARTLVQSALGAIRKYYLNPTRKFVKHAYGELTKLAKLPGLQVVIAGTSKVLMFGGKTLNYTGKVLLFPIDNPATAMAYRLGERGFNKIVKLAAPKISVSSSALLSALSKHPDLERILAELETIRLSKTPSAARLLELEEELLKRMIPIRKEIILKNIGLDLSDIINDFYPELKYGPLSQKIGFKKIIEAEDELLSILRNHENEEKLRKYIVLANSNLSPVDRLNKAMMQLNKAATPKLAIALQSAHQFGEGSVFGYSWSVLREKYRLLTQGGFTPDEANKLIRSGFAGNPPPPSIILRPHEANQDLAHKAITEDLYNGEILSMRRFSENDNRNEIFLVTIKGNPNREAIFKPRIYGDIDGWARTPMEYVSYYLNRKLGMDYVPPTAYRKGLNLRFGDQNFTEGAFSFRAPDYKPMSKLERETFPVASEEILSDHRVLSVLLDNPDGHYKNLGLGRHWVDGVERPVFLDWNACLRPGTDVSMTKYSAMGNSLPVTKIRQETYNHLQKLNENDFKPLIDVHFITNDEMKKILSRRDEILKYFDDLLKNANSRADVIIE